MSTAAHCKDDMNCRKQNTVNVHVWLAIQATASAANTAINHQTKA